MSVFSDAQKALDQARRERDEARSKRFAANEKLRELQRRYDELKRMTARNAGLAALAQQAAEMTRTVAMLRARETTAIEVLADREQHFEPFSDPTKNIERLDDRFPVLLFPLRIETRFKKVRRNDALMDQLWIRVYPDDIAVDTFEELLADVEIENARIYWTNIWKAAGREEEKRAAWRSLVKSHGSGRAYWIIGRVAPTNPEEEPVFSEGVHILVIVTEKPLTPPAKAAAQDYWRDVFMAGNDPASLQAAQDTLVAAIGPALAETIVVDYVPQNLAEKPASAAANVRVAFLELPAADQIPAQQQPWMHPAQTALLPERLVVLGFNGDQQTLMHVGNPIPSELVIGPNPSAPPEEQMRLEDDELIVPAVLEWMTDFDTAVDKGMGFRIDLSPTQAQTGFDRLFVLGLRLSTDAERSRQALENLIRHHQRSRKGFSILPQGAPTNNVEDAVSGYSWIEDADFSYDHYFVQDPHDDPDDWRRKKDGRWLAESLGIAPEVIKTSPNYHAQDQCEARAMNEALWPATLGYFMEQMMPPVFDADAIASTRAYFNRYVLGRGTLPAIRVGRQPYGILPTTAFSRITWIRRDDFAGDRFGTGIPNQYTFLNDLYDLILKVDATWRELAERVSYVGKPDEDPHQALLDVVGLHPSSVEFYQRYAESTEQLYNRFKLSSAVGELVAALVTLDYVASGTALLSQLGHETPDSGEIPEILNKFFLQSPNLLKGPIIDEGPLSETDPIRPSHTDGGNYIAWLLGAARQSHDTLRQQAGFIDDRPPTALLYLMLHHALDLAYVDTGLQLHLNAGLLDASQVAAAKVEPKFLHIQPAEEDAGSPWQYLYKSEPAITNDPELRIAEFIPQVLGVLNPYLNTQLAALEHLAPAPTARLERAFAEHIDCCTNRLDAWWLGLLNVQLTVMRSEAFHNGAAAGCYLGAFGWVEGLRPDDKPQTPITLPEELDRIFNKPGQAPLQSDASNFGYIHAPSLNHAVTAAVLRNGYLSNATPDNPESLSINLTSERVRLALGIIEGIRNGQSLSALLGYQLERGLHDQGDLFLDTIIFELRRQFPLVADRFANTRTDPDVAIEAIEARNVVDGLALIAHVESQPPASQGYPFGLGASLPEISTPDARAAIDAQVQRIMNINDAVADLAMAESVYQVAQGNFDRAAASLDAYSKGHFPPTPEVVQTPRSGVTLTHRVGLHFQGNLDPDDPVNTTPRAKGEPAINAWLADVLPPLTDIYCEAAYFNHGLGADEVKTVTAADLGLLPVDLLYMVTGDGEQQLKSIDDRVLTFVMATPGVRQEAQVLIRYRSKQPGRVSFFEITPLIANLRALLLRSRPLRATDAKLPNEAHSSEDSTSAIREIKVTRVRDLLKGHNADLAALANDIDGLMGDPDEDIAANNAIDNIDAFIDRFVAIVDPMNLFGLPGTGFGFTWHWRRRAFTDLADKLNALVDRWDAAREAFETRLTAFANLDPATSDADRIAFLLQAALLIATEPIEPPVSGNPQDLLDTLNNVALPAFEVVYGEVANLLQTESQVGRLYKAMAARINGIARHDAQGLDLEANRQAIVAFAQTIQSQTRRLTADVDRRLSAADELISGDSAADAAARIQALTAAVRKLTSEDFVILPEFTLSPPQADEWQQASDNRSQLLAYLKNVAGVDFPVDDWLYGIARVREKMHHLESATMLAEAFNQFTPELVPLQFPYRVADSWLGLQFPATKPGAESEPFVINEDKLLYTAHYHTAFDGSAAVHCGLLVDEWTEVIPTVEETTGVAFHYDRPNTEAPQTLLLALPPDFTGRWEWQDLIDTLHETLDLARRRAVEPRHLDQTAYARFLPAVLSSVTRYPITHTLNYAFNNAVQYDQEDA